MKTRYPMLFVVLTVIMVLASLMVPGNMARPIPAAADAGVCAWHTLDMPGSVDIGQVLISTANNSFAPSEVEKLVTLSDKQSLLAIVNRTPLGPAPLDDPLVLYVGSNKGISWSPTAYTHLATAMFSVGDTIANVYDIAAAPDDPNFWAAVTAHGVLDAPVNVWVTSDGGASWQDTGLNIATGGTTNDAVGAIDISPDYGGKRDIAVGLRSGINTTAMRILVMQTGSLPSNWNQQTITGLVANTVAVTNADVVALKFSPNYIGDDALAIVFSMPSTVAPTDMGTFYNVALRDLSSGKNDIAGWAFTSSSIEVRSQSSPAGASPDLTTIVKADLALPADFSGQSSSLRQAYVSVDDITCGISDSSSGIYGINDTQVNVLMDTTCQGATGKRIHSIAFFGTVAAGKLLAGEVIGSTCSATVPIWAADSVVACTTACWYPSLKSASGAADNCSTTTGNGNAEVAWSADGEVAYAGTGCTGLVASNNLTAVWYSHLIDPPSQFDESAISISRNNGQTWNQIGFVNTYISQFTDVAVSADAQTIFLASTNNQTDCHGHDSVWRASRSAKVTAPLSAAFPLGYYWERVFCHVLAVTCNMTESNIGLLRLPPPGPDCDNAMVVGWAAQNTIAQAWSPDYGDYWAMISPRHPIQDFAFESPTMLYDLSSAGIVQKMPYTGIAWSSAELDVDTLLNAAHSIAAQPEGKVLVGGASAGVMSTSYPAAISVDGGKNFMPIRQALTTGNYHVAFHPQFDTNRTFFIADDSSNGTVYRLTFPPTSLNMADADMMAAANGAVGSNAPHPVGIYGLQLAYTGADNDNALYAAHDPTGNLLNSGVDRTLWPLGGMPKPGIYWDCLNVFSGNPTGVIFNAEPWSLKLCGCCTMGTNTKVCALDNRNYIPYITPQGFLWGFEDCVAKKGPALITEDGTLIGCDPVSGRAQEVNLCWEQLCVATGYDIEIAKDSAFTTRIIDWVTPGATTGFLTPVDVTKPCVYFPAGGEAATIASAIAAWGNLECGHQYFWRIQVRQCATGQIIRSPWSDVRSFTVKAGLPVRADYYGLKLLAPDNGCLGCPVQPASFSWSPFKETTKYKFVLAKDAAMTQVLAEAEVPTTAYEYNGKLDYSTNYFWHVISEEPAPSDWSATFCFQTEPAPAAPVPPAEAPATPLWVWVVIAIGAILVIITLVLIFKTRRE